MKKITILADTAIRVGSPTRAREEVATLLGDITALRASVATLATSVFPSKLRVHVRTEGDDSAPKSLVISVDERVLFRAPAQGSIRGEPPRHERTIAPGKHVIAIEIERDDVRGPAYKTRQVSRFSVVIPENKLLEADILVKNKRSAADDSYDAQDGRNELDVTLQERVTNR